MTLSLAGERDCHHKSNFYLLIKDLIETYLAPDYLNDRLQELPRQFDCPHPRKWAKIEWQQIQSHLIVDIEPAVFLAILKGAIDTEAPIRDYTHTSRQYLDRIHPAMAKFVGGTVDELGNRSSKGIWELEESRHAPALIAIYQQLSGERIQPNPKQARAYQPTDFPNNDLYRHGLSRIATEYGATCLYIWLMGHSTGTLQQVIGEMLRDEINHLIKFWGFGVWLYPAPTGYRFIRGCRQLLPRKSASGGNLLKTYYRMLSVLHWGEWSWQHRWQLVVTFWLVMQRLLTWHHSLNSAYLKQIFGILPDRFTHKY